MKKPFECRECHKRFAQKSTLISHKTVHTGEKPFECDKCFQKFAHKSNLTRHKKIHDKRYDCDNCEQRFLESISLSGEKLIPIGSNDLSSCREKIICAGGKLCENHINKKLVNESSVINSSTKIQIDNRPNRFDKHDKQFMDSQREVNQASEVEHFKNHHSFGQVPA